MKKIAIGLLLSTAISAPAFAADAGTAYISADYGSWSMANAGSFSNPNAITLSGGYHFTPNIGIEAGYAAVGDSTVNYIGGSMTYSQSALKVAAVGTYPITSQFDIFGKVGVDSISGKLDAFPSSQSTSTTNLMYGIGGQYNINRQFGVRLQYESLGKTKADPAAPGSDVKSTSIGVVYNF